MTISLLSLLIYIYIFIFRENDCAFARKLLLLFPFLKAQGVMWCRTCVVQYLRDAPCFIPFICMKEVIRGF